MLPETTQTLVSLTKNYQLINDHFWWFLCKKYTPPLYIDLVTLFHVYLMRGFQKYLRNWILTVDFWATCKVAQTINHSQFSPSGSTFLHCLSLPSKNHGENSISFIFLESPHQVDMKNVIKSSKHFFGYFNTLETHSVGHGSSILLECTDFKNVIFLKKYLYPFLRSLRSNNLKPNKTKILNENS